MRINGSEHDRELVTQVRRIARGTRAALCVNLVRFHERLFCELRVEETGPSGQWGLKASRVAVRLHEIEALIDALRETEAEAKHEGEHG